MNIHESAEDYLEKILMLQEKKGSVRSIDIAVAMGFSKPSVSRAIGLLKTGGYVTMEDKALASKKSTAVMENAAEMKADMLITACPLCLYNLTKNTPEQNRLPVLYFTELLAEALGVKD